MTKEIDKVLLEAARAAKDFAFAPYSRFKVGAAVRTSDGQIFSGCNVENASYGLAMCAERVAIFSAVAQGARQIESLALTTDSKSDDPISQKMSCGACRQVMAEFMEPTGKVIIDNVGTFPLAELLPEPFKL